MVLSEIPNLKWSVLRCTALYSDISKKSLLSLHEKLDIITYPKQKKLLNRKSELLSIATMQQVLFKRTTLIMTLGNK